MLLRTLLLALWPLASWGAAYDFDYRAVGDPDARPANVFDDGAMTYFQFAPGRPIPAILKVGPSGEQLADWRPEGPYIVVAGVLADWRLRLGRGIAAVRYAGHRQLAMKGELYGAAVPISETGPAASAPVVVGASTAHPERQGQTPAVAAQSPASLPVAAPPVQAAAPNPGVRIPVPPLPEFSGSFVVLILQAATSALQPQGDTTSSTATNADVRSASIRRISVHFAGGAVQASHTDLVKILTAARSAAGDGYIAVSAFSGAANADTRARYIARRLERMKASLLGVGVPAAKIRFAGGNAGRAAFPRAVVEFVHAPSHTDSPRPRYSQAGAGGGGMVLASLQTSPSRLDGGMVMNPLAVGFNGAGIASLSDRARNAVAAITAAGIPNEKVRLAPVTLAPEASMPRADILLIRNRSEVSA